jgi:hypothetical protein
MATKAATVNAQHEATSPEYPYQPSPGTGSSLQSSPKGTTAAVKITLKIKKR